MAGGHVGPTGASENAGPKERERSWEIENSVLCTQAAVFAPAEPSVEVNTTLIMSHDDTSEQPVEIGGTVELSVDRVSFTKYLKEREEKRLQSLFWVNFGTMAEAMGHNLFEIKGQTETYLKEHSSTMLPFLTVKTEMPSSGDSDSPEVKTEDTSERATS
ncbi:hypothetical protein M231_00194 [Tremella mesenterica]|uniref:Uncharacterized protein n=1 Tax=Tremella mesenterica TaxID=5217 RepID=A0A4Q1BWV4_TREME|nr:uncharacterized protein TREMEDRAFT_59098 [Tremella mesenterica DSM 1558]EIW72938.1 hypothetical protein TREMEDRAFT_59098 [Tremella mesenterica DSM 1558]RXK42640.1 hypothetical protein M231_00194 [Tremella mesenterica]